MTQPRTAPPPPLDIAFALPCLRLRLAFAFASPWPCLGLPRLDFEAFLPQLRCQKASLLEAFWRQNRAKVVPRRLLRAYFLKNVDVHETSAGVVFGELLGPQDGAKIDPRSPQDSLKTDLKRDRFLSRFYHRFWVVLGSVLAPSWVVLGLQGGVLGPSWGHPGVLRWPQDRPKIAPRRS